MEAEANVGYRFDMFEIYIDTAIKMRKSLMTRIVSDDTDTRKALDNIPPKAYMVMIIKTIFRIRTPDDVNRGSKLQIRNEYIREIDRFFSNKDSDAIDCTGYRAGMIKFLDLLNIAIDSNFSDVESILNTACDLGVGDDEYLNSLFNTVTRCLDHVLELYDQNIS